MHLIYTLIIIFWEVFIFLYIFIFISKYGFWKLIDILSQGQIILFGFLVSSSISTIFCYS
jgi:hypothetical protein